MGKNRVSVIEGIGGGIEERVVAAPLRDAALKAEMAERERGGATSLKGSALVLETE